MTIHASTEPYLLPHPFDAFGKPPTPGLPYSDATDAGTETLEAWLVLQAGITEAYEREEEAEDDQREARREIARLEDEAKPLADAILVLHPEWAKAIADGLDPREEAAQ